MEFHTAQSLFRIHGISIVPGARKSWRRHFRAAWAALIRTASRVWHRNVGGRSW